jgi:hypothetical protein
MAGSERAEKRQSLESRAENILVGCSDSETGTGFAGAKLSEILPAARVARFVRMTWEGEETEAQGSS